MFRNVRFRLWSIGNKNNGKNRQNNGYLKKSNFFHPVRRKNETIISNVTKFMNAIHDIIHQVFFAFMNEPVETDGQ